MNVPSDQLDRWRIFAELARQTTISVRLCYARGKRDKGRDLLQNLHDQAIIAAQGMERMGAQTPVTLPTPAAVPLEKLDTPANRRYLRLLEETYAAALDVDDERGYGREGAGPAGGALEMLLADTREEVFGPVGLVRE